jgi:hypothetical protein
MGKAAGTKSALAASSPQALRPRCGRTPGEKANLCKKHNQRRPDPSSQEQSFENVISVSDPV